MKRKVVAIIQSILLSIPLFAQEGANQQLLSIFRESEQCYLMDDYQQLELNINRYADIFKKHADSLGDSLDVYRAYYYKMCGTYYYGLAEDSTCANYSEECYRMSLDIFNRRNNVTNSMVLHEELAQLYYKAKDYVKAKTQLDSVYNYYDERFNGLGISSIEPQYFKTLSQLAICNARLGNFDLALKQINEAIDDYYRKDKNYDYYEALRKRGKILMLKADSLGSTYYKKAVDSYQNYVNDRYFAIAKDMSMMNDSQRNQYWLATHQFLYDCFRLGNRAPEMLYDLVLFSKDYLVRKETSQTKWKQVKQSLDSKSCAIEFVQYFGRKDEKRLGCLVLKKNNKKPLFIDLFSTDSLLNLPLTPYHTIGSAITYSVSTVKDELYNDPRLATTIWSKSLMDAIGNAQKVYFAPDGLLNQLAIEYIMPDTAKICYRLSSTRILTQKRPSPKMDSALLCGGIQYDASVNPNDRDNDVVAYRFLALQTSDVSYLPGTKTEVDSINVIRSNPNDTLIAGSLATDEAFLQLVKRNYSIIHLATHGYYGGRIGIYNDIKPLLGDQSMSKSGVLFAGVSNTLNDKNFDEDLFDGVLSASEISKQDLSKTDLIVLSACQTGLGHLTDDGVYGIQRGLKLAGANAMMLTLWSVNDYSANVLMRNFYKELQKQTTKNIHAAFLEARKQLMQEERFVYRLDEATFTIHKSIIRYNTPQHINPFIIIDAY